jgi:hypothetical protein
MRVLREISPCAIQDSALQAYSSRHGATEQHAVAGSTANDREYDHDVVSGRNQLAMISNYVSSTQY